MRLQIASIFLVAATTAIAGKGWGPVTGCTFYEELRQHLKSCVEPQISKCSRKVCVGPFCISYPGKSGYAYRPLYLIEVTTRWGKSLFAEAYCTLNEHLKFARKWYKKRSPLPQLPSYERDNSGGGSSTAKSYFWHARTLPVPFAAEAFAYPDLPPMPGFSSAFPSCYYGISEFVVDQWQRGSADAPFAAALAEIAVRKCSLPGTSIANSWWNVESKKASSDAKMVGKTIEHIIPDYVPKLGCAYPVPAWLLLAQNLLRSSDAISSEKMCMGEMGGLLPRQGLIVNENVFRSAVMAAWKFASLSKDAFIDRIGGIETDDKWQLVYPLTNMRGCYRPGNALTDWPMPGPNEKDRPRSENGLTYVFAIWRKQETSCFPPLIGEAWEFSMKKTIPLLGKEVCGIL